MIYGAKIAVEVPKFAEDIIVKFEKDLKND